MSQDNTRLSGFFERVVGLLPESLQDKAKFLVPVAVGVVLAAEDLTISAVEFGEIKALAVGAGIGLLVYVFPNLGVALKPKQPH